MPLPNGVSVNATGRLEFVTQRGYFAPPYVSCMFAALGSILIWMGYEIPLERKASRTPPENFVWTLHKQSGAALNKGSTVQHTKNAMGRLLPDAPMYYGAGFPAEIIDLLEDNAAVRVAAKCSNLPNYLRRHVGDYTGGHAFAIIGTKVEGGVRKVFWLDPMARPWEYSGEWIPWDDVKNNLSKNASGETVITWGFKNTAVDPNEVEEPEEPVDPEPEEPEDPDEEIPPEEDPEPEPIPEPEPEEPEEIVVPGLQDVFLNQRGTVAAGAIVFHPATLSRLYMIPTETPVRVHGITEDGLYRGIVARTTGNDGTDPKYALVSAELVTIT